jgi:hypothetical protein
MKIIIFGILILFISIKGFTQESVNSNGYGLILPKIDYQKLYTPEYQNKKWTADLVDLNENSKILRKIRLGDMEMFKKSSIQVIYQDLKNITKILIVNIEYMACCSNIEDYYFMVDKNNNLIELPEIENSHCDGPEPYYTYIFPNQDGGEKDKIIYVEITPNEKFEREKIEILKTYFWNGESIIEK